jgi:broad specificity phosphatase PhoE
MATTVVLVRHGQARAFTEQFIAGHDGCKGLSDLGRNQAEALRDRLARSNEVQPDVVGASVLPRAIETAEIALPGAAVVTDCDWCEQHVGAADGMTIDEFTRVYGGFNDADLDHPISPGGESARMFNVRVRRAVDALQARYRDQTVVLFTHGGFVAAATLYALGGPGLYEPGAPSLGQAENTSMTVLVSDGGGRWSLGRYNDAAHLSRG